jgi:hypothetical protein
MKCKTKDCQNAAHRRGVCQPCLSRLKAEVANRRVTWEFLELCGSVERRKTLKPNSLK